MTDIVAEPGEVLVYAFQVYDARTKDEQTVPYKAPLERIEQAGGRPLLGTAEAVPVEALDREGRYRRIATGWGALD